MLFIFNAWIDLNSHANIFIVEIFVDSIFGAFGANSGLFDAAKWGLDRRHDALVCADHSDFEFLGHSPHLTQVAAVEVACETDRHWVGNFQRLFFSFESSTRGNTFLYKSSIILTAIRLVYFIIEAIGPNISSLAICMLSLTPVIKVGSKKHPPAPGGLNGLPPVTTLAPFDFESSNKRFTLNIKQNFNKFSF